MLIDILMMIIAKYFQCRDRDFKKAESPIMPQKYLQYLVLD